MVVNIIPKLMEIGLSEYEAKAYAAFVSLGPSSAYAVSKASGIPTSKVYEVIARLEEKGLLLPAGADGGGKRNRYTPLEPDEFIETVRARTRSALDTLKQGFDGLKKQADVSHIWNIREYPYLIERAERMLEEAQETVLASLWAEETIALEPAIRASSDRGVKVSIIHFGIPSTDLRTIFVHPIEETIYAEKGGRGMVMVTDSSSALTGTIYPDGAVDGAWGTVSGFVTLAEDYIKHDIYVMKILRRYDRELKRTFGTRYEMLRDVFSDEDDGGHI